MKSLLFVSLLFVNSSLFAAGLDDLLGTYKATDRDGTATVTKRLVKPRDLFNPDVFAYEVRIIRKKHDIDRSIDLESEDGKTLIGNSSDDCDNPDCHAFDSLDVIVKKVGKGAELKIDYEGYDIDDGDEESRPFSGNATFKKNK